MTLGNLDSPQYKTVESLKVHCEKNEMSKNFNNFICKTKFKYIYVLVSSMEINYMFVKFKISLKRTTCIWINKNICKFKATF